MSATTRKREPETNQLNLEIGKKADQVNGKIPVKWTPKAVQLLFGIMLASFLLRFFMINEPAEVVFDEVHFGGFASNYLRREYYFDVHPPLGKLMVAGVAKIFGYDGGFTFARIGQSYVNSSAPYVLMRTFMALLGVASIGLSFGTLLEMGFSAESAAFSASLLAFDNALIIQSRFILLDAPLMFFISLSLFCWVRFRAERSRPFSVSWWTWMVATGATIGAATSVKMVGLLTVMTVGVATIIDLWELTDGKKKLTDRQVLKHFLARASGLAAVPLLIYLGSYAVHFAVLSRTGPGDGYMSADFQAGLEGNQMHSKARRIQFGQTVTLKSRLEEIFLHSHPLNYPRIHEDNKVSSEGQQVTGYSAAVDTNNWWKVLPASGPITQGVSKPVENNDLVRLLHVGTGKLLYTHDVASPLTRTNMEVTVYEPDSTQIAEHVNASIWRVEVQSKNIKGPVKAYAHQIKLVNLLHGVALTNWQQPLPDWGLGHREINGDKRAADENSLWVFWEIREPMDAQEKQQMTNRPRKSLSFWQKYKELQLAQLRHNAELIDKHPFKSSPASWPFVQRGVSYWDKDKTNRIYLLGNPLAWYICLVGLLLALAAGAKDLYRGHRQGTSTPHGRFWYKTSFLLLAWSLHYLPFFTMARTLYLHHYLPALIQSAMIVGACLDYFVREREMPIRQYSTMILISISACVFAAYLYFAPITYGTYVPSAQLQPKKWLLSWDWP